MIIQSCLFFSLFLLFSLEVEVLVELGDVGLDVGFSLLEVILKESSHAIKFLGLFGIHLILQSLLLLSLSLLLHLLVEPLLLLVLEELFTGVIFYVILSVRKSSPSN